MKHITTKEHYDKCENLVRKSGMSLKNWRNFFGLTKEELLEAYNKNKAFNKIIPLQKFDNLFYMNKSNTIRTLSDNVCTLKHLLVFEILEAEPEFITEREYVERLRTRTE